MTNARDIYERFSEKYKVNQETGCWEWIACIGTNGYGAIGFNGKKTSAHRIAYELFNNEIPEGMHVCHRCDNRKCVNPDHLFIGTRQDNMDDMKSKKRQVYGEKHPSTQFSEQDIFNIFEKYSKGMSALGISREYQCERTQIWQILTGRTWKYLKPQILAQGYKFRPTKIHRIKLRPADVLKIIKEHQEGNTFASLSRKYEVSFNTITDIFKGNSWNSVTGIGKNGVNI